MKRRQGNLVTRALLAAALLAALLCSGGAFSGASFSSASANPKSQLSAAADWVPPQVSLANPGAAIHGTVTLTATASDPYGSGVASVRIQRAPSGTETWTDVCTATAAPYACSLDTSKLSNGRYDFRAVATDNASLTSTSLLTEIQVDNTAPSVTMKDPGAVLSGVVTLSAEASDEDSGVASVAIQYSPAGKSTWTEVCSARELPYSCRFDTRTVAEGSYDLRAVATDAAGNSKTSATVASRRIDNTVSTISLDDPGAYLRGTVTLSANASSQAGVSSVTIQRAPAGGSTWTEICRVTTAPYTCSFNTTAVADGLYDLRATMTTGSGTVYTSATVASRRVDNTVVRGTDLQAFNKVGGTAGKLEPGDSLALYYSTLMKTSTIVSGWSGAAPTAIYVRLLDGNLLGTGNSGDTLQFSTDSAGASPIALGSVSLHGDFVKSNKTVTFTASLAASTRTVGSASASTLTVTIESIYASAGLLQTSSAAGTMVWTPSATATDLGGGACSTAPVSETGSSDLDF